MGGNQRISGNRTGRPLGVTRWLDPPGVSSHSVTPSVMIVAMSDFGWN
jgi:hypothetical protein